MVSTFTTNLAVEKPGSGDYSGTWDVPANSNYDLYDQKLGTAVAIPITGSITLSAAQQRCQTIVFTGTLLGSATVTFTSLSTDPTIISGGKWTIINQITNSSLLITLTSTVAGQEVLSLPPNNPMDFVLLGTGSSQAGSFKFTNLPPVGTLVDLFASSYPSWMANATVPAWLPCDGAFFSPAMYPALTATGFIMTPDLRGRYRVTLNEGTGRTTAGPNANSWTNTGGSNGMTITSSNITQGAVTITDPGHSHTYFGTFASAAAGAGISALQSFAAATTAPTSAATTGITATFGSGAPTAANNLPPSIAFGITVIRAG